MASEGSDPKRPTNGNGQSDSRLSLPFDHYERYDLTRRILDLAFPEDGGEALRVLDIGGASSTLKLFVPRATVILVDPSDPPTFSYRPDIPFSCDGYVQGLGGQLPFADASFDVVTAHDTLEHVPPEHREAFLQDALRVAGRLVILNGPVQGPDTHWAEERLALFWKRALEWERHPALSEHLELGLPSVEDIHAVLDRAGIPYVAIPNGNLTLWLASMTLKHHAAAMPEGEPVHEAMDRFLNQTLASRDFQGPCYREAQVIAKTSDDAALLETVARTWPPRPPASPADAATVLEPLIAALESHAMVVRGTITGLNDKVADLVAAVQAGDKSILERDATLVARDAALARSAEMITDLQTELAESQEAVAHRDAAFVRVHSRLLALDAMIRAERSTLGYRALAEARQAVHRVAPRGTNRRGAFLVARAAAAGARGGLAGVREALRTNWVWPPRLVEVSEAPRDPVHVGNIEEIPFAEQYRLWRQVHALTPERVRSMTAEAARFEYQPRISIVLPVYNSDPVLLTEAIESVRSQIYSRWELCIAEDCSPNQEPRRLVEHYTRKDRRIRARFLATNLGIAGASNEAFALATGPFVALLDHDDALSPDALFEVVKLLNEQPDIDFIYTDEDKLDTDGSHVDPFFKPDWSPDLLLSMNYVTHFSIYRKELLDRIGGFRIGVDGSQDYDLVLRATALTDRIAHIPKILYSWRKAPGSAATSTDAKPYAYPAARRAIADRLASRNIEAEVVDSVNLGSYIVRYALTSYPKVGIVIPSRDNEPMLRRCVDSIRKLSSYANYEVLIVDHDSRDPASVEYLNNFDGQVLPYQGEFNFSRMVNLGVAGVDSEMVLLLNNDVEVVTPDWLEALIEHGQRAEVAAVGARLLLGDGRPQHEGILVGSGGGLARNLDHRGYFCLGDVIGNRSAVTAACMLVRRSVFEELGGFDEELGVDYNDVDFCLRAREKGYLVVYTPRAVLTHDEGSTRGTGTPRPHDVEYFRRRWNAAGPYRDPYYNPNLDLDHPFSIQLP